MTPPGAPASGSHAPISGSGSPGYASWWRISRMNRKPTSRNTRLVKRYWSPMTLWSVETMRIGRGDSILRTMNRDAGGPPQAAVAPEPDMARTYVLVLLVEMAVIALLYLLGRAFA